MLKKYFCILIIVFISLTVSAQENWIVQKLSNKISISFPKTPKKVSETAYGVKDSTGVIFAVSISEIAKAINFDLTTFDSVVVEQEFANDFLEGFKPSMPKYTFNPVKVSTLIGKPTYQFEGRDEGNKSTVYFIAVFIDGIAYNFTCILPDGKSVQDKNLFFKGIKINM